MSLLDLELCSFVASLVAEHMHNGVSLRVRPISIHERLALHYLRLEAVEELFSSVCGMAMFQAEAMGFWNGFPLGSTNATLGGLTPLVEG